MKRRKEGGGTEEPVPPQAATFRFAEDIKTPVLLYYW